MKKFLIIFAMMFAFATSSFAEQVYNQNNYAGSSQLTDNVSIKLETGASTSLNNMFDHGDIYQTFTLGVEKYFTPWLGAEIEGRTNIGYGDAYNSHTAFDFVNVSGNVKFNLVNLFNFTGERKAFEPVVFAGIGWGHATCSQNGLQNWMSYRAGAELTYNFGKERAFGVMVSPSVVWGDVNNGILRKANASFEISAGVVYHFKTSNGNRSFAKAKLYDSTEIADYQARINELRRQLESKSEVKNVVEVKEVIKEVTVPVEKTFIIMFEQGKADLSDEAIETLNAVNGKVKIVATASPEGSQEFNQKLSERRAQVVAKYLEDRGVEVEEAVGLGVKSVTSNRVAIITIL